MRRLVLPLVCLVFCAPLARAEGGIPIETLKDLKSATVFVKVDGGRFRATGSGFLVKVDGETGYIVTNHHVVHTPGPSTVSLVFWSGTKKEKVVPAEVVASDPDPNRDLAVLKVTGFKGLPKPIDLAQKVELIETMTVYAFGFPFGQALSTTNGNPALTVGKGSVSSIHTNEFDQVARVQIDGELNPGNSGGPVVDEKGRLVGVAVAKIRNTHIGFAVPPGQLARMLAGRVASIGLHRRKIADGQAEIEVVTPLLDPMGKIKSVAVYYVEASTLKEPLKADKDGRWPALPGARKLDLKRDKQRASAMLKLASAEKKTIRWSVQTVYVDGDGQTIHTQPVPLDIDFSKPVVASGSGKDPKATEPNDDHAGPPREVAGVNVTNLKLDAKGLRECLCWSADGKSFFTVDGSGVLRRIGLADFKEEKRLDLERKCGWLAMSAEGLVATLTDQQQAWVIDPKTFEVKAKIDAPAAVRVATSPALSVAFACSQRGDTISVLDLKTGELVKQYRPTDFGRGVGMQMPVCTPDGKYLFTYGGLEQIFRLRIDGKELKFEEASQRIAQGRLGNIEVSSDSKYVCIPSGGGNYPNLRDHPSIGGYTTYVYPVTNLNKPAFTLDQGAYPQAVGFDPKGRLVYTQNHATQLLIYTLTGIRRKEVKLEGSVRQYLVHPAGRRLLLLTDRTLYHIELPQK